MDRRVASMLAAVAVAVAGCGYRGDNAFLEGLPDVPGLALEVTGDAVPEGSAQPKLEGAAAQSREAATSIAEYVQDARQGVRQVNDAIRAALAPVQQLVQEEGRPQGADVRVYGPRDSAEVTYQLTVKRLTAMAFGWRLEAKPLGAADPAYVTVMSGAMQRGAEPNRGRGFIGIDLDHLKAVNPDFQGQGVLLAGFANRLESKTLAYRLNAFTPDTAAHDPVTAAFVGFKNADTGIIGLRLAAKVDLPSVPNDTAAKELLRVRARYLPGVGGRAAVAATGGDLPPGEAYLGLACFDQDLQETFKVVRRCVPTASGQDCSQIVTRTGDPLTCTAQLAEISEPAGDLNDTAAEAGAADTDVTPPAAFPPGDAL